MELFHVLNRGVEKRNIVMDDKDRLRFVQGLYLYNDENLLDRNTRRFSKEKAISTVRKKLVNLHAFCLMDNHYHLLLSPVDADMENLSAFMRKLNMGYAKYFNEKYRRVGALWQGKYKKIYIARDSHFLHIPYYIHLNPLDYKFYEWRSGEISNTLDPISFLKKYKWSSFLDYFGTKNYPSLLTTDVLKNMLGTQEEQIATIKSIISNPDKTNFSEIIELSD
ncbi:hypothetical protein CL653_01250 [bacterium]|nr:hypothetical protein [bacterium]|tara:strand:+ start:30 stop:695 length:666 start_codon:yes stop_codon:yes gene_type:complete